MRHLCSLLVLRCPDQTASARVLTPYATPRQAMPRCGSLSQLAVCSSRGQASCSVPAGAQHSTRARPVPAGSAGGSMAVRVTRGNLSKDRAGSRACSAVSLRAGALAWPPAGPLARLASMHCWASLPPECPTRACTRLPYTSGLLGKLCAHRMARPPSPPACQSACLCLLN